MNLLSETKNTIRKNNKKKLMLICCESKLYKEEKCRCKEIKIIQNFIRKCNYIYKNIPSLHYNKTEISYYSLNSFDISKKNNNDKNNKIRENIIGAIINNKIINDFYKYSLRWTMMKKNINDYIEILIKEKNIEIISIECNHKGGRNYHYDFSIIINKNIIFNIELKFNAYNINNTPQFVSPMKPSQYLTNNYEEYYYDNYLTKLSELYNLKLPDRNEYVNSIHSTNPICMKEYQNKYYNGCSSSSKYSGNKEDIDFYNYTKKISKESIKTFIENNELNIIKLSNYLQNTQKDKFYMLYKNNKFYLENIDIDNYEIIKYIKKPNKSLYIATTKTNININILLRWKNGNGIAYPAFQIS